MERARTRQEEPNKHIDYLEPVFTRFVRGFSSKFCRGQGKIPQDTRVFQGILTQSSAKFAQRTRVISCEDRFLH